VQAVAADQQRIPLAQIAAERMRLKVGPDAHHFGEHVSQRVFADLVRCQWKAGRERIRKPGVVAGQLQQFATVPAINAAVPHAGEDGVAIPREDGGDRRAHAGVVLATFGRRQNVIVRQANGVLEADRGILLAPGDELLNGLDRQVGCHFAGIVSPHAIGDDEEPCLEINEQRVLVGGPSARMGSAVRSKHGGEL
jgi:hypothetical protein